MHIHVKTNKTKNQSRVQTTLQESICFCKGPAQTYDRSLNSAHQIQTTNPDTRLCNCICDSSRKIGEQKINKQTNSMKKRIIKSVQAKCHNYVKRLSKAYPIQSNRTKPPEQTHKYTLMPTPTPTQLHTHPHKHLRTLECVAANTLIYA